MQELNVDTSHETRSQVGESPSSSAMSYQEICESFESLGSFDWSKEVEMETIQRMQEEEERDREKQKQLEHRLAACSTGNDVHKELESHKRPVRYHIHQQFNPWAESVSQNFVRHYALTF